MNLLLESFFESYGLIIILVLAFALIMVYYYVRNRKFQQSESEFHNSLKVGTKVKTYSGFYGEVAKVTNTTDGKVVTLKLGEGVYIDVDIRALMAVDMKEEVTEEEVKPQVEEPAKKEPVEEPKDEPEVKEELKEEVEEEKPAPKKRGRKKIE